MALLLLYALAGTAQGCDRFPDEDELFEEGVIATVYDHEIDFRSYASFSIFPDVKTAEVDDDGTITDGTLDAESAKLLTTKITQLMHERGYVLVEPTQSPELGIGVGVVRGSTSRAVSGGYWGAGYGGYWGYPGSAYYYPFAYNYTYSTGSIVIDMVDLKRAREPIRAERAADAGPLGGIRGLAVVWGAITYKALPALTVDVGEVSAALEQAFRQSPYLRR